MSILRQDLLESLLPRIDPTTTLRPSSLQNDVIHFGPQLSKSVALVNKLRKNEMVSTEVRANEINTRVSKILDPIAQKLNE